jgi:hypothetical protein
VPIRYRFTIIGGDADPLLDSRRALKGIHEPRLDLDDISVAANFLCETRWIGFRPASDDARANSDELKDRHIGKVVGG